MSNLTKLLDLGAHSCAGDLIWNHRTVGHLRDGDLILTDAGREVLERDVTDVVVKEVTPKQKPSKKQSEAGGDLDSLLA